MNAYKSHHAHTNGIRMHYIDAGEGPLVLLCHGWPESWYSWRHQIDALVRQGYRVVVPDQRGYGSTEAPREVQAYDIFQLVGDLVGLMNHLGQTRAALIGHDWGSMVTAAAALLRPDLFTRIGLLSVPYLPRKPVRPAAQFHLSSQDRHFYQAYFQQEGRVEAELEADLRRSLIGILYSGSGACRLHPEYRRSSFIAFDKRLRFVDALAVPDELPPWLTHEDVDFYVAQFRQSGFRGPINWYRNFDRNWSLTPFLDGALLRQPAVFITGALDGVLKMTAKEYEDLERNAPQLVGKHLIPEVGHWVQQESPEAVNRLLIDFLNSVPA